MAWTRKGVPAALTRILNTTALAFILISLLNVGLALVDDSGRPGPDGQLPAGTAVVDKAGRPDIYVISLDGFNRADLLAKYLDFDISRFTDFLTARGFWLCPDCRSNYDRTFLSLPSLLSMGYLSSDGAGATVSYDRIEELRRDYPLIRLLKQAGYKIVAISASYEIILGDQVDVPVRRGSGQDFKAYLKALFYSELVRGTPLNDTPPGRRLTGLIWRDFNAGAPVQEMGAIDLLAEVAGSIPGPKFVQTHLLGGHGPFIFKADCTPLPEQRTDYKAAYIDQMTCFLGRLEAALEAILARPGPRPVILIMGDHGLIRLLGAKYSHEADIDRAMAEGLSGLTVQGVEGLYGIFLAVLPPQGGMSGLTDQTTPINLIRAIMNAVVGADLAPLPDKSYLSEKVRSRRYYRFLAEFGPEFRGN